MKLLEDEHDDEIKFIQKHQQKQRQNQKRTSVES